MIKVKFLLLFSILLACNCFSQQDSLSIRDKIATYNPSKDDIIVKGRMMIADNFQSGKMEEITKIMDYFEKEVDDGRNLALLPEERLLLYYWTKEYGRLTDIRLYQMQIPDFMKYYYNDSLFDKIVSQSRTDYKQLVNEVQQSGLYDEDADFLILLLNRLLIDKKEKFITLDKINKEADQFIKTYPDSPLTPVVKEHISYKWIMSDWVFGMMLGGGYALSSGNLTDYFNSNASVNLSADVYYKRAALYLSLNNGFGKVQQDIQVKNDYYWEKGASSVLMSVGFGLGYSIFDNAKFRITPFAGISLGYASPSGDNLPDELKKFNIGPSPSPMFGLNLNRRFFLPSDYKKVSDSGGDKTTGGSVGLNFRFTYVPGLLNQEGCLYSGNIFYFSVGVTADFCNLTRAYRSK